MRPSFNCFRVGWRLPAVAAIPSGRVSCGGPWLRVAVVGMVWMGLVACGGDNWIFANDQSSEAGIESEAALPMQRVTTEFSLPGVDGKPVTWSRDPSVRYHVICFLGTECPLARVYGPRLQQMAEDFGQQGVEFIGVVSNEQDSMEDVQQYAREYGIEFPVAKDYDQTVANEFDAKRTPEVYVVDRDGSVLYQGRIDDQYQPGVARKAAEQNDLRDAIAAVLDGKAPVSAKTEALGCLIGRTRGAPTNLDVTYCDQVVRVLRKHCVECHREGEIGPFSLDDFDKVPGWAEMSLEVIDEGRMPPWHANPDHGSFANERLMPEKDKSLLKSWFDAGMPYGDPKDLPPPASYVDGWRLPAEPDEVYWVSDQPFQVPAVGTVEYQYYVVDPGFTEDKWISASQVVPGEASVLHHCIAFIRPPDGALYEGMGVGMLSGYVPGQIPSSLPEGYALKVPAGSHFVFQMHYTPTGKAQSDRSRLGIVFADPSDVTHEVIALSGIQQEFEIPAGESNCKVEGSVNWFPKKGLLLSVMPHMHLRGKSFEFRLKSGATNEVLLDVPAYDFNWQHVYELSTPLPLDEVDELSFSAVFDNSGENPSNPDHSQTVYWGDQTGDEMAVAFVSVAMPIADTEDGSAGDVEDPARSREDAAARLARMKRKADAFADRYIERFDQNGDGFLTSHEVPHSVRLFGFWQLGGRSDATISREEISQAGNATTRDSQEGLETIRLARCPFVCGDSGRAAATCFRPSESRRGRVLDGFLFHFATCRLIFFSVVRTDSLCFVALDFSPTGSSTIDGSRLPWL